MTSNAPNRSFVRELRRVLYRLYDPRVLQNSPLIDLPPLEHERTAPGLQKALIEAIEALEPDASVSPLSDAARTHSILTHRFVDQFSQPEVAATLGLSVRQLQRDERVALHALAAHLVDQYSLQPTPTDSGLELRPVDAARRADHDAPGDDGELRWMEASYPCQAIGVMELLEPVLSLALPLTQTLGVRVECDVADGLPQLAVQEISLRQALLNLLTTAMRAVPGGTVQVRAEAAERHVCISILPSGASAPTDLLRAMNDSLPVVRQLVSLSSGSLRLTSDGDAPALPQIQVALPTVDQIAVLAIDDNADSLQLLERHLAGTRYRSAGVRDPQKALDAITTWKPRIVLLDVMLPGVDGWELLGRLREHPDLRDLPIVVCTILPMEQFALALGAAAFIRKPVSQEALLTVLDRLSAPPCSASS